MAEVTTPTTAAAAPTNIPTEDVSASFSSSLAALSRGDFGEATAGLVDGVLVPAVIALVLLIVTYFAAQWFSRWISTAVCKRVDQTLGKFAGKFAYYSILAVACMTILQVFGFQSTGLAAIMAAAGFAIGLAFQGTLSNFASGILLLVFRPFKVGDVVNVAGVLGKVNEIDLFTTTLDTPDNRRLIIPNGSIADGAIENITYHAHRRVDVTVGVAYTASLDDTRAVLTDCVESLSDFLVAGENRGFQVLLSSLGASSVDWTVRFWTTSENFWKVKEALTSEIKQRLDAGGIEIPFPQMQLHLDQSPAEPLRSLHGSQGEALPIPKMSTSPNATHDSKIRPRARGSSHNLN